MDDLATARTARARQLDELEAAVDHLRDALTDNGQSLAEVRSALGDLLHRVDRLEHHQHTGARPTPVDLDQTDSDIEELARQIRRADRVGRLPPAGRRRREHTITIYENLSDQYLQQLHEAVRHSRTLVHGHDERAASSFKAAQDNASALLDDLEQDRPRYDRARQELDRDDQQRQAGEQGEAVLQERMRDRISATIGRPVEFPPWFTAQLGYGPPADAEGWLDTAAKVLAYRIIYNITDRVVWHGGDQPERRRRREELDAALKKYRPGW